MNSIQSNDSMTSMGGGKSTQVYMQSPGSGMGGGVQNSAYKGIQMNAQGGNNFQIGNLNQRSQQTII